MYYIGHTPVTYAEKQEEKNLAKKAKQFKKHKLTCARLRNKRKSKHK